MPPVAETGLRPIWNQVCASPCAKAQAQPGSDDRHLVEALGEVGEQPDWKLNAVNRLRGEIGGRVGCHLEVEGVGLTGRALQEDEDHLFGRSLGDDRSLRPRRCRYERAAQKMSGQAGSEKAEELPPGAQRPIVRTRRGGAGTCGSACRALLFVHVASLVGVPRQLFPSIPARGAERLRKNRGQSFDESADSQGHREHGPRRGERSWWSFRSPLQGSCRWGPNPGFRFRLHPGLYSRRRFAAHRIRDLAGHKRNTQFLRRLMSEDSDSHRIWLLIQWNVFGRRSVEFPYSSRPQ